MSAYIEGRSVLTIQPLFIRNVELDNSEFVIMSPSGRLALSRGRLFIDGRLDFNCLSALNLSTVGL